MNEGIAINRVWDRVIVAKHVICLETIFADRVRHESVKLWISLINYGKWTHTIPYTIQITSLSPSFWSNDFLTTFFTTFSLYPTMNSLNCHYETAAMSHSHKSSSFLHVRVHKRWPYPMLFLKTFCEKLYVTCMSGCENQTVW